MDDQPPAPLLLPPHDRAPADQDTPARPAQAPQTAPPPDTRAGGRSALWLLLVLLIVAGLVAWVVLRPGNQPAPTGRFQSSGPMPVGTSKVETGDMPIVLNALGAV